MKELRQLKLSKKIKTMNKTTFSIVFAIILSNVLFSQAPVGFDYAKELERVSGIPNSPEAEAFAKYGHYEAQLYYGKPNISIPLFDIKGRELNLAIGLNNQGSAIKVNQLATQVGLGWDLSIGGRITRVVNGLPDDPLSASTVYKGMFDTDTRNKIIQYLQERENFSTEQELLDFHLFKGDIADNKRDAHLDYFKMSAFGRTYDIVFDIETMEPVVLNNPNIKVEAFTNGNGSNQHIAEWLVTFEDGTLFYFGKNGSDFKERTNVYYSADGQDNFKEYYSSWVIRYIESPNKKDIYRFQYQELPYWSQPITNFVSFAKDVITAETPVNNPAIEHNFSLDPEYRIKQQLLTDIFHNENRIIELIYKNRDDIANSKALDKINYYQPFDFGLIKTHLFEHSYFGNSSSSLSSDKRLKLDRIQSLDNNGIFVYDYTFEYDRPEELPNINSKGRDYLGYYNGKDGNTNLLPSVNLSTRFFGGGNRNVFSNYAGIGMLNKIIYPTGGYTIFNYEPHFAHEYVTETNNVEYAFTEVYGGSAGNWGDPGIECYFNYCQDNYTHPPNVSMGAFEIVENNNFLLEYIQQPGNEIWEKHAYIFDIDTSSNPLPLNQLISNTGSFLKPLIWNLNSSQSSVELEPSNYQIVLINGDINGYSSLRISRDITTTSYQNVAKSGMRIKNIKNYNEDDTFQYGKEYNYVTEEKIHNPILFYITPHLLLKGPDDLCATEEVLMLNRVISPNGGDAPEVVYMRVEEIHINEVDQSLNGKTVYDFEQGSHGYSGTIVSGDPVEFQHLSVNDIVGTTKSIKVYNEIGSLISETKIDDLYTTIIHSLKSFSIKTRFMGEYDHLVTYEYNGYRNYYLNRLFRGRFVANAGQPDEISECYWDYNPICEDQNFNCYYSSDKGPNIELVESLVYGYYSKPSIKIKKEYFGLQSIQNITTTTYDPSIDHQIREVQFLNSSGESIVQRYDYPKDRSSTVYQEMVDANQVSHVIQTEEFINSQSTIKIENEFRSINNGYQVDEIKVSKNPHSAEIRMKVHSYDSYGNAKEVSQNTGSKTSYLWGYHGQYLLAKIENASFNSIPFGLRSAAINASNATGTNYNEQALLAALDALRDGMPQAMVTTFTHKPLIGISTVSDAKGNTQTFFYDDFGRLIQVKDEQGNLVNELKYQYAE